MGRSGGRHGSSGRLCLVLIAGWAGVVGCILAAHDFLIVNFGFTLSRSEGTLACSRLWAGDVGVSGPRPLSCVGAGPGAGLVSLVPRG